MSTVEHREEVLLERLRGVVRDQSMARIARATDRSRTSVTRYMKGAKLPLEFGAAMVEEFGLNPDWLLTGREPMYLADVPAASTGLGNELLDLMRSIDNVAKLKLGALSGRTHAKALREIGDTLDRYGSLRDRLNRMSAPLLNDLLDQADEAAGERKLDRARALLAAAGRLHRFCDDRDLSTKLLAVRGLVYHIDQDLDAALELREQFFHATLASDANFDAIARPAIGLALVLRNHELRRRARRVARIGMAYAAPDDRTKPDYCQMLIVDALASIELGEFEGLASAIEHASEHATDEDAQIGAETAKYLYNLQRGLWDPREIAGARVSAFPAAVGILDASYLTDDAEVIERAWKQCRSIMLPEMPLNQLHVRRGELVLKALRGSSLPPDSVEPPQSGPLFRRFAKIVNRALLLRLQGDGRAIEYCIEAQRVLEAYPEDRTPLPSVVAIHLKNVLSSVSKQARKRELSELRAKAEALCAERIKLGYGQLRMLLE